MPLILETGLAEINPTVTKGLKYFKHPFISFLY